MAERQKDPEDQNPANSDPFCLTRSDSSTAPNPSPITTPASSLCSAKVPTNIWVTLRNGQRIPQEYRTRGHGQVFGFDMLLSEFPALGAVVLGDVCGDNV
ncbi:hypothetical protein GQ43DRAFT_473021 [Delitschia confertaspora ATCC 74209]|uniref:Uncharacterized protein n=1 Tax=Delitschia confertaspora ATCC 74209 TaxID=1513339 RepID=A0A9P4JJ56_9PLEO|nr:hypothetical protein GQ43DRAFT_473021 [Delitschia confertaspora ATCC 74209]